MIDKVRALQNTRSGEGRTTGSAEFQHIKERMHAELVESLDFEMVRNTPRDELVARLRDSLTRTIRSRNLPLNQAEQGQLVDELLDDLLGLGPLEPLLRDPDISDILINGHDNVYVEKGGKLSKVDVNFHDNTRLMHVIDRIVGAIGRRVDESNPMVDARLQDGSRVNAIIPPLALDGPVVSIRRFGKKPVGVQDLIRHGSVPRPILAVLRACVRSKLNIIISGGTGTGKTTMLNVLSSFIPQGERIITIEDAAELRLQQPHVVRLETRPPNLEGTGEVTARDLVKNSLRMRPDRIILGEIRGDEAIDMLQAMNTGHDGSFGTIHANTPRDALSRLETMVGMGMPNLTDRTIREMISRAVNVVVQLSRLNDGSRRLIKVTEITGMEGSVICTQDVFVFEQTTVDKDGKVRGVFRSTGIRPKFAEVFARYGIQLSKELTSFSVRI